MAKEDKGKPATIEWKTKGGKKQVTNDNPANIEAAEKLGWKRVTK